MTTTTSPRLAPTCPDLAATAPALLARADAMQRARLDLPLAPARDGFPLTGDLYRAQVAYGEAQHAYANAASLARSVALYPAEELPGIVAAAVALADTLADTATGLDPRPVGVPYRYRPWTPTDPTDRATWTTYRDGHADLLHTLTRLRDQVRGNYHVGTDPEHVAHALTRLARDADDPTILGTVTAWLTALADPTEGTVTAADPEDDEDDDTHGTCSHPLCCDEDDDELVAAPLTEG